LADSYSVAGIKDSIAFNRFYEQLRAAVVHNNRTEVSKLFHYPMDLTVPGGAFQKPLHIDSAKSLLKNYELIFSATLRNTLQKTPPKFLWANWQGVTTPDGSIWLGVNDKQQFTIITINVPSAKALRHLPIRKDFPKFIFGTWKINEITSVGVHDIKNAHLDQVALGKEFGIYKNKIACDRHLKWMGGWICSHPRYQLKIGQKRATDRDNKSGYHKGDLGYYAIPDKNPSLHIAAICICDKKTMFTVEVAADNRLVSYYDGWLFFAVKK